MTEALGRLNALVRNREGCAIHFRAHPARR